MIEVTKRKRKRRKKVPFQAGGEQPQGSGSKPPPVIKEEPEDSHGPTVLISRKIK